MLSRPFLRALFYALPAATCAASFVCAQQENGFAVAQHADSAAFRPFTGKVKAKRVRVRVHPDLESHVVSELDKDEVLAIVGEADNFWAIDALPGMKAYVFRSFVLDNVVEGSHVNVRLQPNIEAPAVAHLNTGDKVQGLICQQNTKWLEISMPVGTRFWVAKDLIEPMGGPELKVQYDKRKVAVDQLLEGANLLSKSEMRRPFPDIDFQRLARSYNTIIQEYTDFPAAVEHAKGALASLHETYLQKKIAYLEAKAYAPAQTTISAADNSADSAQLLQEEATSLALGDASSASGNITDKMLIWKPVEEALYLTWAHTNEEKSFDDFYSEQKLDAIALSGILEAYTAPVKNRPGDYIIKQQDIPLGYVYSTQHNLQQYVGKRVTLIVSQRPNNHFAYPAYYVHSVE